MRSPSHRASTALTIAAVLGLGACGGIDQGTADPNDESAQRAGDRRLADGIERAKKEAEKHKPGGAKEFEDAERYASRNFEKLIARADRKAVRAMLKNSGSLPPDLRSALERRRRQLGIPKR